MRDWRELPDGHQPPEILGPYLGKYGTGTKNRPPTVFSALFSLCKAIERSATINLPAIVRDQNHMSICRVEGGGPLACAASLYIALRSSHRKRRVNPAVLCKGTV